MPGADDEGEGEGKIMDGIGPKNLSHRTVFILKSQLTVLEFM